MASNAAQHDTSCASLMSHSHSMSSPHSSPCDSRSALGSACRHQFASFPGSSLAPPLSIVIVPDKERESSTSPLRTLAGSHVQRSGHIFATSRTPAPPATGLFKLQPRQSSCIPPPAKSNRGRKRNAGSISSTIFSNSSALGEKHVLTKDEHDSVSTTLPEDDTVTPPMMFFHPSAPPFSTSEEVLRATAHLHTLAIASPASISNSSPSTLSASNGDLKNSSFSKYYGSPAGSSRSAMSPSLAASPSSNSTRRMSPARKAPLTVLSRSNGAGTKPPPLSSSSQDCHTSTPESICRHEYMSATPTDTPSRSSVASVSTRTPLPKVSLTPRSHGSRPGRLPVFPSPEDRQIESQMILHSPSASSTSRLPGTNQDVNLDSFGFFMGNKSHETHSCRAFEDSSLGAPLDEFDDDDDHGPATKKPESFIPLPDWGIPSIKSSGSTSHLPSGHNDFILGPPRARLPIRGQGVFPGNHTGLFPFPCDNPDPESLSGSDDEDAFFLVAPSGVSSDTCKGDADHPVKHRRLQSQPDEKPRATFASSIQTSQSSLLGMGFLPSATSLRGLCSNGSLRAMDGDRPASLGLKNRESSSLSIDLALDQHCKDSDDGHALKTPPSMPQAHSPPPLSPHCGTQGSP